MGNPRLRATGRTCKVTGLPLVDAREFIASIDWGSVHGPRSDDVGLELEDGSRLTTADEVDAYFAQRDHA